MRNLVLLLCGLLSLATFAMPAGSGTPPATAPLYVNPDQYTYRFTETGSFVVWTAPVTHKVSESEPAPTVTGAGLRLAAARNEFEPLQVVLPNGNGAVAVTLAPFPNLGVDQRVEVSTVGFFNGYAETLTPLPAGATMLQAPGFSTALWLNVYVPKTATAGTYQTTLTLTHDAEAPVVIPVTLQVFDFTLPDTIHFGSAIEIGMSQPEEPLKDSLYEHRLTPIEVTYPSSFDSSITWDSASNPERCTAFYDQSDLSPDLGIGALAQKYVLGIGWNELGFPTATGFRPVTSDSTASPRPETFCEVPIGPDRLGTQAYNDEWSLYLTGLNDYLVANGLDERVYAWLDNEAYNQADYELAAKLCRLAREAAPDLKITMTEGPQSEIVNAPGGDPCGYDRWIGYPDGYDEAFARSRQADHGEEVWFYTLGVDPTLPNPYAVQVSGTNARILPWVAWNERGTGWYIPQLGGSNPLYVNQQAGVRAELLREGFEDYEYLYLANANVGPPPVGTSTPDPSVNSVAAGFHDWTDDDVALPAMHDALGAYLEGSRTTLPVYAPEPMAVASALGALVALAIRARRR